MKYSRSQAKGRCIVHRDEATILKDDKLPRGLKAAVKRAAVGTEPKVSIHTRRKCVRKSVFDERNTDRRKNLERWIENANNSIIETPENKRRNLIKAAWRNVIRKENNEKRNTLQLGNAEVSGNSGAIKA
jgi:hypothetical protein